MTTDCRDIIFGIAENLIERSLSNKFKLFFNKYVLYSCVWLVFLASDGIVGRLVITVAGQGSQSSLVARGTTKILEMAIISCVERKFEHHFENAQYNASFLRE